MSDPYSMLSSIGGNDSRASGPQRFRSRSRSASARPPPLPTTHEEFFGMKRTTVDDLVHRTRQPVGKTSVDPSVHAAAQEVLQQTRVQSWAQYVAHGTPAKASGLRKPSAAMQSETPLSSSRGGRPPRDSSLVVEPSQNDPSIFTPSAARPSGALAPTPFGGPPAPPNTPAEEEVDRGRFSVASNYFARLFATTSTSTSPSSSPQSNASTFSSSPASAAHAFPTATAMAPVSSPVPSMPVPALKKQSSYTDPQGGSNSPRAEGRASEGRVSGLFEVLRRSISRLSGVLLGAAPAAGVGAQALSDGPSAAATPPQVFADARRSVTFVTPRPTPSPQRGPNDNTAVEAQAVAATVARDHSPTRSLSQHLEEAARDSPMADERERSGEKRKARSRSSSASSSPPSSRGKAGAGGRRGASETRRSTTVNAVIAGAVASARKSMREEVLAAMSPTTPQPKSEQRGFVTSRKEGTSTRGVTPPPTPPELNRALQSAPSSDRSRSPPRNAKSDEHQERLRGPASPPSRMLQRAASTNNSSHSSSHLKPITPAAQAVLNSIYDTDRAERLTNAQLLAYLKYVGVAAPAKAKKVELMQLVRKNVGPAIDVQGKCAAASPVPLPTTSWTKKELKKLARQQGANITPNATKEDLLALLK